MTFDSTAAAKTIKDAVAKLDKFTDIPASVKANWQGYVALGKRLPAAVLAVGGPSVKDVEDLKAKKKDLTSLQNEIDLLEKKVEAGNMAARAGYKAFGPMLTIFMKINGLIRAELIQNSDKNSKQLVAAAYDCYATARTVANGMKF